MMADREYKLAVIREAWPRTYNSTRLIEYLRGQDNDRGIDAVLIALGIDPATLRNPLPDVTLMDELEGGPG